VDKIMMAGIRAHNEAAGFFFFSRGAMRFFRSRVLPYVYQGPGGVAFVTSEKTGFDDASPRRHTARTYNPATGEVRTLGPSHTLRRSEARQLAKWYASGKIGADIPAERALLYLAATAEAKGDHLPESFAKALGEG
jgi:hypothetical protein